MGGAGREAGEAVPPAPAVMHRRKVVLCGGFGRGHVGDEAALHAQHRLLTPHFDLVLAVDRATAHPDLRNWWPYGACEVRSRDEIAALVRDGDVHAVHLGGGSPEAAAAAPALEAAVEAGKRALMTGIDAESGTGSAATPASRALLERLDLLSVRFRRHFERLSQLGVPVHLGADWALGLAEPDPPARDFDVLLTVRGFGDAALDPLDSYRRLVADLQQAGRRVTPLPFSPDDMHLFNRMGLADAAQEIHWHDPRTVQALIRRSRLVVGIGRIHPLILALRAGRPCLAIDPDVMHDAAAAPSRLVRLFCRDFGVPCYGSTAAVRAAAKDFGGPGHAALPFPEGYIEQYQAMADRVLSALTAPERGPRRAKPAPAGDGRAPAPAKAGPRKVYHLHVAKCGGTAVNVWLDLNVHAERARPPAFMFQRYGVQWAGPWFFEDLGPEERRRLADGLRAGAEDSIRWFDVLHGHVDISPFFEEGAYIFSILRDPPERVLSQFRDYRRLVARDYAHKIGDAVQVHEACRTTESFAAVAEACDGSRFFRFVFEDMECRALTQSTIPFPVFQAMGAQARAAAAFAVLENRCARFGVQERMGELLCGIAADLGWAPVEGLAEYNVTDKSGAGAGEADLAAARSLTAGDSLLYARVLAHLDASPSGRRYGTAEFERDVVAARVEALSPMRIGAERVFDMNMPVIGSGFSGRDAPHSRDCCAWIGPDGHASLYFPVPAPGLRVMVRLHIKGWVHESLRAGTTFLVDGLPVVPTTERRPEVQEVVCLPAVTQGAWMKVEVRSPRTMTDAEAGRQSGDRRRKLFNLWRYGYEPLGAG